MAEKENYKLLISKEELKNIAKYLKENESHDNKEDKSYKILEKIKSFFSKKFKNLNIKNFLKKFLLFLIILGFNYVIYKKLNSLLIKYEDLTFGFMGPVLAALITVDGVFAGFYFNKRQTYKEIVTRERIEWLHKIQEKLAFYLDLTTSNKKEREKLEEDYKNTVDKVYYEILFNINHDKDKNAVEALENYHKNYHKIIEDQDKFEIELEKIDDNNFKIKDSKDLEDVEKLILEEDKLKNKVIEEFVKIFNETWRDIKSEADWGLLYFFLKRKDLNKYFLKI